MTISKYEELQGLTEQYGEETSTFYKKVKDISPKIINAYISYLGGPKTAAISVPPDGDFDPGGCNRDSAFDIYAHGTLYLEPIRMGVCTNIANMSDSGATWVRTVLEFQPSGDGLHLSVGHRAHKFNVSSESEPTYDAICEAIFQDTREAFSVELDEAQGRSRFGFI